LKQIIIKLTIFSFLLIAFLFLIEFLSEKRIRTIVKDDEAVINNVYNLKERTDFLIMGSSRAVFHLSPSIIDSVLGVNSYNIGMLGANFELQYDILKVYLQHHENPKTILLSLDLNSFCKRDSLYKNFIYLPYLDDSSLFNVCKKYKNGFDYLDLYLPLYKYRDNFSLIQKSLLSFVDNSYFSDKQTTSWVKGYWGNPSNWNPDFLNLIYKEFKKGIHFKIDSNIVHSYVSFLNFCKTRKIEVVTVYTPDYFAYQNHVQNRAYILNLYQELSTNNGTKFINLSNDSISHNTKYYYDAKHLNKVGSEATTLKTAQIIQFKNK